MVIRKTAQSFSTLLSISRKTRCRSRWRKEHANFYFYLSLHKKWSFPLRISSENVTVNVTMFQWFYPNFAAILQNYVLSISFSCDFYFHGIFQGNSLWLKKYHCNFKKHSHFQQIHRIRIICHDFAAMPGLDIGQGVTTKSWQHDITRSSGACSTLSKLYDGVFLRK